MPSGRTFTKEFREAIVAEVQKARESGVRGAVTEILSRERISGGTFARWEHGRPSQAKKRSKPGRKPAAVAGYRVTFYRVSAEGNEEGYEAHHTQREALDACSRLASTGGVMDVRLWTEKKYKLIIQATIQED